MDPLDKGNVERAGVAGKPNEQGHSSPGHPELSQKLGLDGQSFIAALDHLEIVVPEADGSESGEHEYAQPDVDIGQIAPKQNGGQMDRGNNQTSHGGSALLFVVVGHVFLDVLPELEPSQPGDEPGAQDDAQNERREQGIDRSEGDVAENIEQGDHIA